MSDSTSWRDQRDFVGFYVKPAVKERAKKRAQEANTSLSELMRRLLRQLEEPDSDSARLA